VPVSLDVLDASADEAPKTLLITLTGRDRPGVTSTVFSTLATFGGAVLDIEQIVLRRRLVLGVLVTAPRDWKRLRDAIVRAADELDMSVEVDRGSGDNQARKDGQAPPARFSPPSEDSFSPRRDCRYSPPASR